MKTYVIILILGVVSAFSSCSTYYYYMPATHNVPLFTQKGDIKLSAGLGCSDDTYSMDFHGAYSILDYLSVSANLMGMGDEEKKTFNEPDGVSYDGAVGFFRPLGKSMVVEAYGGIGGYSQHNQYLNGTYTSDIRAMRLYLQPDVGYVSRKFEIAFSTRITKLNFTKVNSDLPSTDEDYLRLTHISRDKRYMLIEPALTLRIGSENQKFQVQFIKALPEKFKGERLFDNFHVSIGFILTLNDGKQE